MHQWHSKVVWAAEKGYWELVKQYLADGEDVEKRGHCGWTALGMAAGQGHLDTVRLLVELYNADLEARDEDGKTALLWAVANGHSEVVQYLLGREAKFDREGSDSRWRPPVAWAARNGFAKVVALLAEQGADLFGKDDTGQTPMSLAVAAGRWDVVKTLEARGLDVPESVRKTASAAQAATAPPIKHFEKLAGSDDRKGSEAEVTQRVCPESQIAIGVDEESSRVERIPRSQVLVDDSVSTATERETWKSTNWRPEIDSGGNTTEFELIPDDVPTVESGAKPWSEGKWPTDSWTGVASWGSTNWNDDGWNLNWKDGRWSG